MDKQELLSLGVKYIPNDISYISRIYLWEAFVDFIIEIAHTKKIPYLKLIHILTKEKPEIFENFPYVRGIVLDILKEQK